MTFCDENQQKARGRGFAVALEMLQSDFEGFITEIFKNLQRIDTGEELEKELADPEKAEKKVIDFRLQNFDEGECNTFEQEQHLTNYWEHIKNFVQDGQMAYWTLNEGVLSQKLKEFCPDPNCIPNIIEDLKQVIPCFTKHPFLNEPEVKPDIQP